MDITAQELKQKLDNGDDFILIDVREQHEHDAFNIGGQLIPLGNVMEAIPQLQSHKEAEIVLYCRSGARSGIAQQAMQGLGFANVRNLIGGMLNWTDTFGINK